MANKALLNRLEREALEEALADYAEGLTTASQSSTSTPIHIGTIQFVDECTSSPIARVKPAQKRRQKKTRRWTTDRPADHVPSIEDL